MMGESLTAGKAQTMDTTAVNVHGTGLAQQAPLLIKNVACISAAAKKGKEKTQPICSKKPPLSHSKP